MGVPQRVDRNARGKIQIAVAIGRNKPNALASLESKVDARIGR